MADPLAEGLERLGFENRPAKVVGYSKDFWHKGDYIFSHREVGAYGIVRASDLFCPDADGQKKQKREQRFTTRKRRDDRIAAEILEKLTKWLANPTF